ncbi:TrmB family transcriptional regulator [Candidatus Bathyarchaeota archaeon]|nr:TrmB family transcriptional regulator [Candidatus Bathyarchaeota archaeon]
MSISERSRQVLREIGLNTYEIDVYAALLEGGQMTAMEISKKANVPYSKIYDVLNSLKDKGWIKSVEIRPTEYYPTPPLEALAIAKIRLDDKYSIWEHTIAGELQPLYEKQELVEHPDILILHGQQGVIAKLEETLKKAAKEIVIATPEFAKTIVTDAQSFMEVLQKTRVNIKLMVTGKAEDWTCLKSIAGISELRVRDQMFGGGIIIDGKEAVLFLGEEKPSLVIWSNHAGLVRFAREYFQFLWDSSKKI